MIGNIGAQVSEIKNNPSTRWNSSNLLTDIAKQTSISSKEVSEINKADVHAEDLKQLVNKPENAVDKLKV